MSQLPKEVVEATLIDSNVGNTRFFRASDLITKALGSPTPVAFPAIDYGGYAPGLIIENLGQKGISDLLVRQLCYRVLEVCIGGLMTVRNTLKGTL